MVFVKVILFCLLYGFVHSDEAGLLKACAYDDKECLGQSTQIFLEKTCLGIPAYNIKPIDPLVIPSLTYHAQSLGVKLTLKYLTITGLKHQIISDFKMDIEKKSVMLSTSAQLNIVADLAATFTATGRVYNGMFSSRVHMLETAFYNYNFITDDKGLEHFDVGSETLTCKLLGTPDFSIEFNQSLDDGVRPTWQQYLEAKDDFAQDFLCDIVSTAYRDVVHNIRAAAKVVPKTAFFNNI